MSLPIAFCHFFYSLEILCFFFPSSLTPDILLIEGIQIFLTFYTTAGHSFQNLEISLWISGARHPPIFCPANLKIVMEFYQRQIFQLQFSGDTTY